MVAYPTLLEAYTLVLYRLGRGTAATWLGQITSGSAFVNPAPEDYLDAVRKVAAFSDQQITLFDATLAALADRLGLPVWTYDHHFDVMRSTVWR